ncbi:MAG: hypothetical protein LBS36_07360 [Oscillospiraceae bacterium]|jgi:D-alanyl-D-alanine carboxypeptidase (penicillin-binding protein 5/6)|nr:hypothetical protein [Oscillospiraceae bacterium]
MKKCMNFVLIILCVFFCIPPLSAGAAFDPKINFQSEALLLMSMDDGTIIIEKNADQQRSPAGLAGIAVAIAAIENSENLDEAVTVKNAILQETYGTGTQGVGLKNDEQIKIIDLLYALMLTSASDAAVVLANHIGGSTEDFLKLMNETAQKAGCTNTQFTNVIGVDDDNQYSTAQDIARLTLYALKNTNFDKIAKSVSYKIGPTNLSNERTVYTTNLMMLRGYTAYYNELAKGIRTGSTSKAGRCVVTTASKDGYSYLAVAMGAPVNAEKNLAFTECNDMLRWTFDHIKLRVIAQPYQTVAEAKVNLSSSSDYVRLVPEKEITKLVPAGITSEDVLLKPVADKTKTEVNAPVEKGAVLGEAQILYAGKEIARVNLVAAESIGRSNSKYIGSFVKAFVTSPIFIIIAVLFVSVALFYVIQGLLRNTKKKKKIKLVKGNRSEAARRMQQKKRQNNRDGKDPDPPKSILR